MKIDVRGLKKIKSDKKSSTFLTAKGHQFIVAHNVLNKNNLKELDNIPIAHQEESPRTDFSNVNNMPRMAEGGGIGGQMHPMWRGVKSRIEKWGANPYIPEELPQEVKGRSQDTGPDPMAGRGPSVIEGPVKSENIMARGGMVRRYAEGTPNAPISSEQEAQRLASAQRLSENSKGTKANYDYVKALPAIDAQPVPADQADPSTQGIINEAPTSDADLTNDRMPTDIPSPNTAKFAVPRGAEDFGKGAETQLQGIQEEQQGLQAAAKVEGALGNQQASSLATAVNQKNSINNSYMRQYQVIAQERSQQEKDFLDHADHLDPNRYLKNMSTGSKILTGIGLLFSGFGSGLAHQSNLASEFLDKQIAADIENQKTALGARKSLLSYNLEKSKDLRDATTFTTMQTQDMLALHLQQQAAQAKSPQAQATLLNQSGILKQKAGALQDELAKRRAFMQIGVGEGGENATEQAFQKQNAMLRTMGEGGEKLAKDRESKHVGGVGQASREVPADVMTQITARNSLNSAVEDLQAFASQHSGSVSPSAIAQGRAKAALVQDMVRQASNAGVFKESEKDFMNKYVGEDPTQLFQKYRSGKGYEEVRKNNLLNLNQLKKSYGMPISEPAKVPQQAGHEEVERLTKDGKIAIFDGATKKFLRMK